MFNSNRLKIRFQKMVSETLNAQEFTNDDFVVTAKDHTHKLLQTIGSSFRLK